MYFSTKFCHFHFDISIIYAIFFLQVLTCGFPPLEDRDKSLKHLAGHDFFGSGDFTKSGMEINAVNDMFVILTDIWLDNEEV